MSRHDTAVHNARRYTRANVLRLLRAAGFRPIFAGYWNIMLFPLMVATRKLLPVRLRQRCAALAGDRRGGMPGRHRRRAWADARRHPLAFRRVGSRGRRQNRERQWLKLYRPSRCRS